MFLVCGVLMLRLTSYLWALGLERSRALWVWTGGLNCGFGVALMLCDLAGLKLYFVDLFWVF